jgi:hypothetical protein
MSGRENEMRNARNSSPTGRIRTLLYLILLSVLILSVCHGISGLAAF